MSHDSRVAYAKYYAIGAGLTDQPISTAVIGAWLEHVVLFPAAVAAGTCVIKDGGTTIGTFTTGTLSDLKPIYIPIKARSQNGGWTITTGANVTALASSQ